jgi:hypothetical protein
MGDRPLPLLLGEERELKRRGKALPGSPAYTAVPDNFASVFSNGTAGAKSASPWA